MQNGENNPAPEDGKDQPEAMPVDPTAKDLWAFAAKKQSKSESINYKYLTNRFFVAA